jgi:hypothetical protein
LHHHPNDLVRVVDIVASPFGRHCLNDRLRRLYGAVVNAKI